MAHRRSVSLSTCLEDGSRIHAHGLFECFGRDEMVAEDEPNLPTLVFILCSIVPHINITPVRLVQNLPQSSTNPQQRWSTGLLRTDIANTCSIW